MSERRHGAGARLFHQRTGLKAALQYVREGGILTLITDQDGTKQGRFMYFFDLLVSFPRALEFFMRHVQVPIVPMLLWHDQDGYRVEVGTRLDLSLPPDQLWTIIRDWMEATIIRDPAQWLLLYDRFKLRHQPYLKEKGALQDCMSAYQDAWKGNSVKERAKVCLDP